MNKFKGQCFTTRCNGLSNILISKIGICNKLQNQQCVSDKVALWDTGATGSAITNNVATQLNLPIVNKQYCSTPSGISIHNVYLVDLILPNKVKIQNVRVIEANLKQDALIGMDIIKYGDFAISNFQGYTQFSFRIPSMCDLDFCKNTYQTPQINNSKVGRNSPCPCGSGKKYKNCCGE
jgi:predicted aspartyl protease